MHVSTDTIGQRRSILVGGLLVCGLCFKCEQQRGDRSV
jgi:hypothetical protein